MAKLGVTSILLVIFVCISAGLDEDPISIVTEVPDDSELRVIAKKCKIPGVSDEEIERMLNDDTNLSYGGKCTLKCIAENIGVVIKDDQMDIAETKKIVEESAVDKEELAMPFYLIDKCGEIKDKDECELAYKLNLCMIEATKEWNSNSTSDDLL